MFDIVCQVTFAAALASSVVFFVSVGRENRFFEISSSLFGGIKNPFTFAIPIKKKGKKVLQ